MTPMTEATTRDASRRSSRRESVPDFETSCKGAAIIDKEETMRSYVLALCGLLLIELAAAPAQAQYQEGDTDADFTLNDSNGTPVSLFDYKNRVVWLDLWRFG